MDALLWRAWLSVPVVLEGGASVMTGIAGRAKAASGVGTLTTGGDGRAWGSTTGAVVGTSRSTAVATLGSGGAGSLGVTGAVAAIGATDSAGAAASAGATGAAACANGEMPISVCERSGLFREPSGAGGRDAVTGAGAAGARDSAGDTDAGGGVDGRATMGAAMPMRVFERSEFGAAGRALGAARGGMTEVRVGAGGGTEARTGGGGGTDARGGAALTGAGATASSSAPQSVSMSSVDGGMDGSVAADARGGWLAVGRGGTEDVPA
jgi:hypothetical protein